MKRFIILLMLTAGLVFCLLLRFGVQNEAAQSSAAYTAPADETAPPTLSATPSSRPTPEPESAPAPAPEKTSWLISFAGDCTIGTLHEWQGMTTPNNMLYVMGDDYEYPFSGVADMFFADDFTLVNLEGTFTTATDAIYKAYRFRAPPEAARALTEGGIEAVTLANNHTGDYREQGLADTCAALESAGIAYADESTPLIMELEGELTLGVIAFNCVEIDLAVGDVNGYMERITPLYEQCLEEACDLTIAYIHWGWEYRSEPERWMETFARVLADLGVDIVAGSHPHILQRAELYEGVPIFYSLGNFCYGGHSAPTDMDSVIVRQEILRAGDGFVLGETTFLPCSISSVEAVNDFRPVPYAESEPGYVRVLEKLGLG